MPKSRDAADAPDKVDGATQHTHIIKPRSCGKTTVFILLPSRRCGKTHARLLNALSGAAQR